MKVLARPSGSSAIADDDIETLLSNGILELVVTIMVRLTGRRPHPSSLWRWTRRPGRGGPLPAQMIYGQWHSTEAAIREWLARKSAYQPRRDAVTTGPSDDALRQRGLLD
jgi:hypothetical protein